MRQDELAGWDGFGTLRVRARPVSRNPVRPDSARRRARLHAQIGARLEAGYGVQARELAAELAVHFMQGDDVPRALRYLRYTAEHALARSAYREAIELLQQALNLLQRLPESAGRAGHELALQATLAPALMAIQGWGSPDAQSAYQRAKDISLQLDDQPRRAAVLVGLATVFEARGDYLKSQLLIEEYLGEVADKGPGLLLVESHNLLACSLFHQGASFNPWTMRSMPSRSFSPELPIPSWPPPGPIP